LKKTALKSAEVTIEQEIKNAKMPEVVDTTGIFAMLL
jgi:hypothetical protein